MPLFEDKPANRRFLFRSALVILVSACALYFASRIRLEEDVSKIIPSSGNLQKLNAFYKNSSFLDKLIIMVSLTDSTAVADPQKLIRYTNKFVQSLQNTTPDTLIKEITQEISSGMMQNVYATFLDNLPLFLTEADYSAIDTSSDVDAVMRTVSGIRKTLVSPAGMVLKNYLLQDPFSWAPMAMRKLESLQPADSYKMHDGHIFTSDEKYLVIFIASAFPSSETANNGLLLQRIDTALNIAGQQFEGQVQAEYFGGAAVSVGNAQRIKTDVTITVALAILLLVIFITIFVRVRWAIILIFLPALFGAVFSLAILYLIKGTVSSIALGVGSILLGIGVDYALYILSQVNAQRHIRDIIKQLSFPIIICSVTSAAMFLCLLFVETEALQELGLFMAFSVMGAAMFSLLVLPSLIGLIPRSVKDPMKLNPSKFITWFSTSRFDRNLWLIAFSILATVVFTVTARQVKFDSDLHKMSYVSPRLQHAEATLKSITDASLKSVYIIASGKTMDEAIQQNERVFKTIRDLKSQHLVEDFSSISPVLGSRQTQLDRIQRWNTFWTPAKKLKLKDRILQASRANGFTPQAFDGFLSMLERDYQPLSATKLEALNAAVLKGWIVNTDSVQHIISVLKLEEKNRTAVYAAFKPSDRLMIGDRAALASQLIGTLKTDFNLLIELSSYVVLLLLIIAFGRIELGVVTFIPVMIGWIWTVGIMGILGADFTIFNIVISTLIFGTGVDYCILITRGMQLEYTYGRPALPALKSGIFLSAATTIIGVGVLYFAQHPALLSIGLLPIAGFLSVVTVSFTLQPIFVRWLLPNGKAKPSTPVTLSALLITIFAYAYFLFGCLLLLVLSQLLQAASFLFPKSRTKGIFHRCLNLFCRSMIYIMVNVRKEIINVRDERFESPAVIVCNHQSVLDILLILMMSPKLIFLTNDWVWNSPIFGKVVRYAQFYPVSTGIENSLDLLRTKVQEGFSIVVFPEGTRSVDGRIQRFHKGACYIAEQLNLDILPLLIHGAADTIKRGEFWVRNGHLTVKVLDRIVPDDPASGIGYSARTKVLCASMRSQYASLREERETPEYFRNTLIMNYLYKETLLEWNLRRRLRSEQNFKTIDALIPKNARVIDLGCGYGFLSTMLSFTSSRRAITGMDRDARKIALAENCFSKPPHLRYLCEDLLHCTLPTGDVFVLVDVLQYLPQPDQQRLIGRCLDALGDHGIIIVRTACHAAAKRPLMERISKLLSTSLPYTGKPGESLYMVSDEMFSEIAAQQDLHIERHTDSKSVEMALTLLRKTADTSTTSQG